MNIEKIKAYNQKILAILGTAVALMAAIGFILLLSFAISELFRSFRNNDNDNGILSSDKIEELQKENKRQQIVSYELPKLVDTLNLVYMIPVSQKTLNEPENIDEGILGLLDTYGEVESRGKRYSKRYYGSFNNLLIYNYKDQALQKLFNKRVNFGEIRTEYFESDVLILFEASSKDTFKDGVINLQDYKSLYLYSLDNKELKEIRMDNADISNYSFIPNTKDLLVQFGLDQNGDGKYDYYNEPSVVRKFDFKSGALVEIVDGEIKESLQKKLEGTEK